MEEIIFLKPEFKEMIWGGNRLKTDFNYPISGEHIGECWAVSAHKNGNCEVDTGKYAGMRLNELWTFHREVFGNVVGDVFPLLIKIIDAKEDLSIQVHPDDLYANLHEDGALGKTECWYVLDCKEDAQIVIGHNAKSKEELKNWIDNNEWEELIRYIPIKKGDFFQIAPGTVHAIKAGTLIFETQQNSDITYRLYDYNRLQNGKPRELHLEKSIDVIMCPHHDIINTNQTIHFENATTEKLIQCEYYTVHKVHIHGSQKFSKEEPFLLLSVIEGEGNVDLLPIKKGDHFIIPASYEEYTLSGDMMLITSHV